MSDPLVYQKESTLGLLLDDQIWLWSISANCFNLECRSISLDRPEDIVLSSMLHVCQELIFETFSFGYFPKLSHSFPLFSFTSNTVTTFTTPDVARISCSIPRNGLRTTSGRNS